jgi:hypothetical protein
MTAGSHFYSNADDTDGMILPCPGNSAWVEMASYTCPGNDLSYDAKATVARLALQGPTIVKPGPTNNIRSLLSVPAGFCAGQLGTLSVAGYCGAT